MIKTIDGGQLLLDFDRPVHIRDLHSETEQTGFLTPEQQISRMLAAGGNLMAYRREFYDYPDGDVPENVVADPTQRLGFDMADASMLLQGVEAAQRKQTPKVEGAAGEKTAVSLADSDDSDKENEPTE